MQRRSEGGRHISANSSGQPEFNLELLMEQATLSDTLQELLRQSGLSSDRMIDYLSRHGQIFCNTDNGTFGTWVKKGRMPEKYGRELQNIVNAAAGGNEPFLTRYYQK